MTIALLFFGTPSPRYNIQQTKYFPCHGSHLTNLIVDTKIDLTVQNRQLLLLFQQHLILHDTLCLTISLGHKLPTGNKYGYGTKIAPSKRNDAIIDEAICPMKRLRLVQVRSIFKLSSVSIIDGFIIDHKCTIGMF